jgi:hypothetical protein
MKLRVISVCSKQTRTSPFLKSTNYNISRTKQATFQPKTQRAATAPNDLLASELLNRSQYKAAVRVCVYGNCETVVL